MHNVITTYGGGELFFLVFNGIAALFKTDNTGLLMPLIRVGLTVGLFYVLILMLFRNQVAEGFKWFLWVIIATNLIFLPKTTIYINDPLANQKFKVDNVPFALGAFAGLVSNVGRAITEQFEAVFTLPDYMPYHQTGTVFASALMRQVGQFRIVDPIFKGNMERFVNQCVVYDAMIGHKYTLKDLQNTPDIWTLVTQNASPVLGFLYKQGQEGGNVITCKAGATLLNNLWTAEITKATAIYGSRVGNQTLTKAAFFTHIQNGFQLMAGISESAEKLLKQEMMINALEEASNNKLSELGAASNYSATKALMQQRSTYAIAGEIAARTLPLFKNVIEALSYALFIFIVVLALLPNGYKILLTYCGILVWTQLWAPLYAVLNLIMTLYGKSETIGLGTQNGLTLLNSSAIVNVNADMTTLAAWLSVSIPFISYGILKQGAAAFVGLAHHLSSGMQSAASGAAAEAVSGNISMGNLSMGTQSYQNTSAFQHNTSPSYSASHFKSLNSSGMEQSTFADGTQSLTSQAISKLGVQIMGTENTSYAQQASFNEAKSLFQSKSLAAGDAAESAFQATTNYMNQVGQSLFKGEDYKKNVTSADAQTLQNFKGYIQDLCQRTGMNESQAVEAAIGASLGVPGMGPQISSNFSNAAARQKGIEAADSLAKQKNYTDSLEKIVSASKDISEGESGTRGADLSESAMSSLNHARSLREEASVAQNQIETLSHDISSGQSKSMTINKDLTQDMLAFIAQQPVNSGPTGRDGGNIGYENARRILENGGMERETYKQRFEEQNPQYTVQSINAAQGEARINSHYGAESQAFKQSAGIESHYAQNQGTVVERGTDKGLSLHTVPPPRPIKQEVTDHLENRSQELETQRKTIDAQEKIMRDAEKEANAKDLAVTVAKNSAKSVFGDLELKREHFDPHGHN